MYKRQMIIVALAVALPLEAAEREPEVGAGALARQISDCRKISDRDARLQCYDVAAANLEQATRQGDVVILDREDIRKTRRSLFGFNLPKVPFLKGDDGSEEISEIRGAIVRANPAANGRWSLVLDDGGTWQTNEVLSDFIDPKPGDAVRIRKAALGSYFMNVAGRRAIRVQRVR